MNYPLDYTRENVIALAMDLRRARSPNGIKFKDLLIRSGIVDGNDQNAIAHAQQWFSRWLNNAEAKNKWKILKEPAFQKITAYLSGNPPPPPVFRAPKDIAGIAAELTRQSMAAAFVQVGKLLSDVIDRIPDENYRAELTALNRRYPRPAAGAKQEPGGAS